MQLEAMSHCPNSKKSQPVFGKMLDGNIRIFFCQYICCECSYYPCLGLRVQKVERQTLPEEEAPLVFSGLKDMQKGPLRSGY